MIEPKSLINHGIPTLLIKCNFTSSYPIRTIIKPQSIRWPRITNFIPKPLQTRDNSHRLTSLPCGSTSDLPRFYACDLRTLASGDRLVTCTSGWNASLAPLPGRCALSLSCFLSLEPKKFLNNHRVRRLLVYEWLVTQSIS